MSLSLVMTTTGLCPSHQPWRKQTSNSEISRRPQQPPAPSPLLASIPKEPALVLTGTSRAWSLPSFSSLQSPSLAWLSKQWCGHDSHPPSGVYDLLPSQLFQFQLYPHCLHSLAMARPAFIQVLRTPHFFSCPWQMPSSLTSLRRPEKA